MIQKSRLRKCLLTLLVVITGCINAMANDIQHVTLKFKDATLTQVLSAIEHQTNYRFSYKDSSVADKVGITLSCENTPVTTALEMALKGSGLAYDIVSDKSIAIVEASRKASQAAVPANVKTKKISGTIIDPEGEPVIGASVIVDGTSNGVSTDFDEIGRAHV